MPTGVVSRSIEEQAVASFLTSAHSQPSGLVIEGEPGIGKTTLWLAAVQQARQRGFRVLSARVGQAESVLAYAALADLLAEADSAVMATLPELQRLALDRVLLRAVADGPATDQRVVAAAFISIVEALAVTTPVLVAIDDVQWLDTSSKMVVEFAARRLRARVGLIVSERCDPEKATATSWLQVARPDGIERIRLRPLPLGGLHMLISQRLGRVFPRPKLVRIAEISGGNPFYALELARAMDGRSPTAEPPLPGTLAELVRLRIGRFEGGVRDVLLAAACVSAPTVELLAQVNDTTVESVVDLLEDAETDGIIGIDGNRVRFSHPLLARGVYTDATPARRRATHRALAAIEPLPELKARHLALATTTTDEPTLAALDAAAAAARARGAPAAAAELLGLAIRLGGDTPRRRITAAQQHFLAGDTAQARTLINPLIEHPEPGMMRALAGIMMAAIHIYDNRFLEAVEVLNRAHSDAERIPLVQVQTLLSLSLAQSMGLGLFTEAAANARDAITLSDEVGDPFQISQARAWWVTVNFNNGQGIDEPSLRRALELEDTTNDVPVIYSASVNHALLLAWTGQLEQAQSQMLAARRRYLERGADRDMMAVSGYSALIEIWRADYAQAAVFAEEAVVWAQQLGGGHLDVIPLPIRATVAAYTGRESDARADAACAIEAAHRCGSPFMAVWPIQVLGFIEVSLGNYAEALTTMQPLLSRFDPALGTELMRNWWLPDAAEAMIAVGRLEQAEQLIAALESNGRRLDRSWMLAVGARGRSMWLAARGDIHGAERTARQAMIEHQRLPMPFERARTQLLLGQLERRQRRKEAATEALRGALHAFEDMGASLWAERARAELARANVSPNRDFAALTPSEQRVAELAASGMTNRDIAAALFISAKTVEHNLSRAYRKLEIRSRAELGRRMDQLAIRETPDSPDVDNH